MDALGHGFRTVLRVSKALAFSASCLTKIMFMQTRASASWLLLAETQDMVLCPNSTSTIKLTKSINPQKPATSSLISEQMNNFYNARTNSNASNASNSSFKSQTKKYVSERFTVFLLSFPSCLLCERP